MFYMARRLAAHARYQACVRSNIDGGIDALPIRQLCSCVRDRVLVMQFFESTNCGTFSVALMPPLTSVANDAHYELIIPRYQTILAMLLSKDSLRFGT